MDDKTKQHLADAIAAGDINAIVAISSAAQVRAKAIAAEEGQAPPASLSIGERIGTPDPFQPPAEA